MTRAVMAVALMAWAVVLGGCAEFERHQLAGADQIAKLPTETIVRSFAMARTQGDFDDTMFDELVARNNWSTDKVEMLRDGTVQKGDTSELLSIARGFPATRSESSSVLGNYEYWRYGFLYDRYRTTFTLLDGRVVAWTSTQF
ncbi:MAG: hypothetical protein AAF108_02950 [Planctomycetota bacterium]